MCPGTAYMTRYGTRYLSQHDGNKHVWYARIKYTKYQECISRE